MLNVGLNCSVFEFVAKNVLTCWLEIKVLNEVYNELLVPLTAAYIFFVWAASGEGL